MTENRAPAQYCPYCGETNLWPHEDSHGAWSCRDCRRVFAVRFIGLVGAASVTENAQRSGIVPRATALLLTDADTPSSEESFPMNSAHR